MNLLATLYWLCVALIFYHHVAYPVLLRQLARRRPFTSPDPAPIDSRLPSISLIIPCHNEAAVVAKKIENVAQLAYPPELLSVVLALDGCTDNTRLEAENAINRLSQKANWRVIEYRQNVGKVAVLNDQVAQAQSEIVALSDASAVVPPDIFLRAASHFADPKIGVVCPTYRLGAGAAKGEEAYWSYQRRLKSAEGRVAAPMGAHGALYLFRRALWEPLAEDTVNDDFILPMRIVLRGFKAVYDEAMVTAELEKTAPGQDFRRRVRIGAGNMQQLLKLIQLGNPRRGKTALVFLSGKGLRAVMPFLLASAVLMNAWLAYADGGIYAWLLGTKLAILFIAALAIVSPAVGKLPVFGQIAYVAMGHLASGWGALLLLAGRHDRLWKASSDRKSRYLAALGGRAE